MGCGLIRFLEMFNGFVGLSIFMIFEQFLFNYHKTTNILGFYNSLELCIMPLVTLGLLTSSLSCLEILSLTKVSWTPKHAGFVSHFTYLSTKKTLFINYNCPPPQMLLGVQLAGQRGDDSLHFYLLVHSLNTIILHFYIYHVLIYGYPGIYKWLMLNVGCPIFPIIYL